LRRFSIPEQPPDERVFAPSPTKNEDSHGGNCI
jgi:hypothetical protein